MMKYARILISLIAACFLLGSMIYLITTPYEEVHASTSNINSSIVVTTEKDELKDDGECSLREAIKAANENISVDACVAGNGALTDTVSFNFAGIITVTSQLSVTAGGPLMIDGGDVITTSGGGTTRVWWLDAGSDLTIKGLAVVNGLSNKGAGLFSTAVNLLIINSKFNNNHANDAGGGIYNENNLTIIDTHFSDNWAAGGAEPLGGGIYNLGSMSILNSTFTGNEAEFYGGAITNSSNNTGTLTISKSLFSENSAVRLGGAIYNWSNYPMEITDSTFYGNQADWGGVIANQWDGSMMVENCTFTDNTAFWGGVIVNENEFFITHSTFNDNDAHQVSVIETGGDMEIAYSVFSGNSGEDVGTIENTGDLYISSSYFADNFVAGVGAGILNLGILTITSSTIYSNTAIEEGGGILNNYELNMINSTISGNSASIGGGIYNYGTSIITNTTIAENRATSGYAGGLYSNISGYSYLSNTIIAKSLESTDCDGKIFDYGNNLDSDGTCDLDLANSSLLNTDPILGPLQNNGGPTLTHPLLEGSPAIDAADNSHCPATDQRGSKRPYDGNHDMVADCDIGSYEFGSWPNVIYLPIVNRLP